MKKNKKNFNCNKKKIKQKQPEIEAKLREIRKYQLEEIKFAIEKYNNIAVTGTFGSGKTFLKKSWIKNKKETEDYLEINAYLFKDENILVTNLIEDLIINKKMKYKKTRKLYFFKWPNINSGFGKFLDSFKLFWSISLSILIPSFFSIFFTFYELKKACIFLYLLLFPGLLSILSLILIILYLNIRFNKLKNYEKLYPCKDINYLIIIVEDLNRLPEVEQKKFMQVLSICIEKLNKNNLNSQFKVKTLILNDFQNKKENLNIEFEWNKYIDYDVVINNDQKNMRDIFYEILSFENLDLWNIIPNKYKSDIEKILELIFQQEDVRLVILFIEKLKYYLSNYNNLVVIKINYVDLISYLYLSVFHEEIFKYINRKPNVIAYNSVLDNSVNFYYDEHWTKLITKELKSDKSWNYEIIKDKFSPLTNGILRKQKSNLNIDNPNKDALSFINDDYGSPNKNIINITELNFFYFFKFPTNLKKFVDESAKAAKEIEGKFSETNFSIIETLSNYFEKHIKEIYYYGNKTIELFLSLTFKLINLDKEQLYLKLKTNVIDIYNSFSKINDIKIDNFISLFKNEFKENVFADIWNILEKNEFYKFNSKNHSFNIKFESEPEKEDVKWLLIIGKLLKHEFFLISYFLKNSDQSTRENIMKKLPDNQQRKVEVSDIMALFTVQHLLYKQLNAQDLIIKIINYESEKNLPHSELIIELILWDYDYPIRLLNHFTNSIDWTSQNNWNSEKLNCLRKIFNSNTEINKSIRNCIFKCVSKTYKWFFKDDAPEWPDNVNDNLILKDHGSFTLWIIKNFENELKEFIS
ncbi:MAG: hypothetical protein ACRC8P_02140 [Spiroplasma sp.]